MTYSDFVPPGQHQGEGGNQQLVTVQWCILAEGRAASLCGSCTLAVLVGCGLLSFPFVNLFAPFFSFLSFLAFWFPISLTVASLQGVAQDFMLSCNHRLTLSLSPVISMSLKSPAATAASSSSRLTQSWFCIAVVFLLALFYSFIYSFICFLGGSILCIPLSVCWLAFLFF